MLATIERVVGSLGLAGARRMTGSYTDMFLALRDLLVLDERDCTFDAFEGVVVVFDDLS